MATTHTTTANLTVKIVVTQGNPPGISGERRSFALLRPTVDPTAQAAVRDAILEVYTEAEAAATTG